MSIILTLVASHKKKPLKKSHIKTVSKLLHYYNMEIIEKPVWLAKKKAVDLHLNADTGGVMLMHMRDEMNADEIDVFLTSAADRRKKLVLADMDSTIVAEETLDELAAHAGLKDQISEITARAMNGELDFHAALNERVGLLKDLSTQALDETLAQTQINQGAQTFIQTMAAYGAHCVLVSGGFTFFTGAIAEAVGFHDHHGNTLEIANGALTGKVIPPILDKHAKVEFLKQHLSKLGLGPDEALTIGDGANDIPMLKTAGLGLGYKPKPAVASEIPNLIVHGDLTTALYAQGFTDKEFA